MCLPPPSPVGLRSFSIVPAILIAVGSLFASAALAGLLALFFLLRRSREETTAAEDHPGAFDNARIGDGDEVDRYVRWLKAAGLDESTIAGIPTWAYKADEGVLGVSPADCAVCLSEFSDGEILRVLPKCVHAFHLGCIDVWLRSHFSCPLCRAPVVAPSAPS